MAASGNSEIRDITRRIQQAIHVLFLFLLVVLICGIHSAPPASAVINTDQYKATGAKVLAEFDVNLPDCYERPYDPWFRCEDVKRKNAISIQDIYTKIVKTFEFSIPVPGRIYVLAESFVNERYFYHETMALWIEQWKDGKWSGINLGGAIRKTDYHGSKTRNIAQPLQIERKSDGSAQIKDYSPLLSQGRYRAAVKAATRRTGAPSSECGFVPTKGKIIILFISDIPPSPPPPVTYWECPRPNPNGCVQVQYRTKYLTKSECDTATKCVASGILPPKDQKPPQPPPQPPKDKQPPDQPPPPKDKQPPDQPPPPKDQRPSDQPPPPPPPKDKQPTDQPPSPKDKQPSDQPPPPKDQRPPATSEWITYIVSGKPFRVIFDIAPTKFNDEGWRADIEDPMGTLKGGETYYVTFNKNTDEWTVTGFNEWKNAVGTWTYSKHRPENYQLNLWGRVFRFDNDGKVFDPQYGHVGHLEKGGTPPDTHKPRLQLSCTKNDNKEKGCCCYKGEHTYLFPSQHITTVRASFDTGKKLNCQSTVNLQIDRGRGWETLKAVQAISSAGTSEQHVMAVDVSVNNTIKGFRIGDGCACCIDYSEITLN